MSILGGDGDLGASSEKIEEIRKKFSIAEDFGKVIIIEDKQKIMLFGKTNKDNEKMLYNYSKRDYDDDKREYYCSYFFDGDDYKVFSEYHLGCNEDYAIVFIKDFKKFSEDFYPKEKCFYEPGIYSLVETNMGMVLDKIKVDNVEMPILNDNIDEQMMSDIESFFGNKEFFKKNNFPYKRGILIHGSPGNGKTTFIKHLLTKTKDIYGVIIDCSKGFEREITKFLEIVLKDKPRIIVLEDIDGVESYNRSALLNLLDGVEALENTLIIATTNFPEKLDVGLINRPSRFDKFYHIESPNENSRIKLLNMFFKDLTKEEQDKYVDMTKHFSCAYFKELFIVKNLQKITIEEAINTINKQLEFCKANKEETSYVG